MKMTDYERKNLHREENIVLIAWRNTMIIEEKDTIKKKRKNTTKEKQKGAERKLKMEFVLYAVKKLLTGYIATSILFIQKGKE